VAHGPDEMDIDALWVMERPNYKGKRRRSTEGAQGTDTGHEDGEAMASVGVRCNAQLGLWPKRETTTQPSVFACSGSPRCILKILIWTSFLTCVEEHYRKKRQGEKCNSPSYSIWKNIRTDRCSNRAYCQESHCPLPGQLTRCFFHVA